MGNDWDERLSGVVFPALLRGLHVYTGFGDLLPGHGIPQTSGAGYGGTVTSPRKPTGMPIWQVYLGVKDTQPAIRFLQFSHRVRNPRGPGALVYPTRLQRDGDRGVALIMPLGEGVETPHHELSIAREIEAAILYRPVRVIALGRFRAFTTKSPWTLSEHLLMEVFSDKGDLIWTNPIIGMSLEEALAKIEANEELREQVKPAASRFALPPQEGRSSHDYAEIILECALDAEKAGDSALGVILRSLAQRMARPPDS